MRGARSRRRRDGSSRGTGRRGAADPTVGHPVSGPRQGRTPVGRQPDLAAAGTPGYAHGPTAEAIAQARNHVRLTPGNEAAD
jgi:hypothetical protein